MKGVRRWLADERGDVVYSYLFITFYLLLMAAAVIGLGVPLGFENFQAEKMLRENNP
ncbi:MAG: hypothetical protein ABW321_07615 [Polyangiales bacterium]